MALLRSTKDIKWLLYRSAPKIDMLYGQIVGRSGNLKASASFNLVGVSGSVGTNQEPPRVEEKLEVVERELAERGLLSGLAEPGEYIKAIMPMRWGLFDDQGTRPEGEPPLVYFGGFDSSEPLMVGLGGSSKNVIGHEGASGTYSRSSTREIVRWLLAGIQSGAPPERPAWWDDYEDDEYQVIGAMAIALHYLRPPTQNLEFLAKTLLTGTLRGHEHFTGLKEGQEMRTILATPIYVAMAAPYPDDSRWGLDDDWRTFERKLREKEKESTQGKVIEP